jgi:anti-sigma B factor antagonist
MEMLRTHLEAGDRPVLRVEGEIDLATAAQFAAALDQALAAAPRLLVDMAGVTFIDVSGLRVLVQAAESLNGRSPLTVVNAPRVAWLFKVIGLSDIRSLIIREGE